MKHDDLYDELAAHGVFDSTEPEDIARVKRIYRNQQKTQWKRQHRHANKSITISVPKAEFALLTKAAKLYHTNRTKFIYAAALSMAQQKPFFPNDIALRELQEALWVQTHYLRDLEDSDKLTSATTASLVERLHSIEEEIHRRFTSPTTLVSAIKQYIEIDLAFKTTLQTLLSDPPCK